MLEGFDHRHGVATYSLRIINYTRSLLICRTFVIARDGEATLAHPMLCEVQPLATTITQVPMWPRDYASFERAIAEVSGEGVHCLVEAPAPFARKPDRGRTLAAASLLAGFVALGTAGVLRAAMPRIDALAVPPEALSGTTSRRYGAGGAGNLSYLVLAPDGRQTQGGALGDRSGSIAIALPASSQPGGYTVRVAMDGPLGRASERRVINAVSGVRGRARINDISVNPIVARPGQAVNVAYSAAADGGDARLVGGDGTIWAQEPFSSGGQTRLIVPPVAPGSELRVLLHVTKKGTTAQSVAGLVVGEARTRGSCRCIAPSRRRRRSERGASERKRRRERHLRGGYEGRAERRLDSGEDFLPRNGMRISLMDLQSHEVTGVDAGTAADVVTLRAPTVSVATRYIVEAALPTASVGNIVAPVTVQP